MTPSSGTREPERRRLIRRPTGALVDEGTGDPVGIEELAGALGSGARFSVRHEQTGVSCTYVVLAEAVRARAAEAGDPMVEALLSTMDGWSGRIAAHRAGEEETGV